MIAVLANDSQLEEFLSNRDGNEADLTVTDVTERAVEKKVTRITQIFTNYSNLFPFELKAISCNSCRLFRVIRAIALSLQKLRDAVSGAG